MRGPRLLDAVDLYSIDAFSFWLAKPTDDFQAHLTVDSSVVQRDRVQKAIGGDHESFVQAMDALVSSPRPHHRKIFIRQVGQAQASQSRELDSPNCRSLYFVTWSEHIRSNQVSLNQWICDHFYIQGRIEARSQLAPMLSRRMNIKKYETRTLNILQSHKKHNSCLLELFSPFRLKELLRKRIQSAHNTQSQLQ